MKIQKVIENYLVKEYQNRKHNRNGHYPSEAYTCHRQLWYKWKNYPESDPIYPTALIKMEIGNGIHLQVAHWLKESGVKLTEEMPFKFEDPRLKHPISGRIDIVYLDENGVLKGIEVKSSHGGGIDAIIRNGEPDPSHLMQVAIYMLATTIKEFKIVYFSRDTADCIEFELECIDNKIYCNKILKDITLDGIVNKFADIEKNVVLNTTPERPHKTAIKFIESYKEKNTDAEIVVNKAQIVEKFQSNKIIYKSDWQCRYCRYASLCWKDVLDKCTQENPKLYNGENV